MQKRKTNKNLTAHLAPHTSNSNNCKKIVGALSVRNTKEDNQTAPIAHKGITLIALIITIIVMLILVAITINVALDSGLFTKTKQASTETSHQIVYENLLFEVADYMAEKETNKTDKNIIEYLQFKNIIYNDLVIIIDNLSKQVALGHGNIEEGDYYKLVEVVETANKTKENIRVASTKNIKIATTLNDEKQYKLVYYGKTNVVEWESEPINNAKKSLGKLVDVVEVGDYVNYSPGYTSSAYYYDEESDTGKELNGWRVAYKDESSGIVTLISAGIPEELEIEIEVEYTTDMRQLQLNFDLDKMNNLFDKTVADNIDIPTIDDIKLICEQAGFEIQHEEYVVDESEKYIIIEEDNLNIFNFLEGSWIINTVGVNMYGSAYYFFVHQDIINAGHSTSSDYTRPIVDLKPNLVYYSGEGTQESPYQIY